MKRRSERKRKGIEQGEGRSQGRTKTRKKFSFFFTIVTGGGWMYYKGILGYYLVIIIF